MNNKPDKFEKRVRFGCGGLFGVFAGFNVAFYMARSHNSLVVFCLTILLFVVLCGFMAMKQGDRFWYSLRKWF
jgi:hypothetical protein